MHTKQYHPRRGPRPAAPPKRAPRPARTRARTTMLPASPPQTLNSPHVCTITEQAPGAQSMCTQLYNSTTPSLLAPRPSSTSCGAAAYNKQVS